MKNDIEQSKLSPEIKDFLKAEVGKVTDADELSRMKTIFDKLKNEQTPTSDLAQSKTDAEAKRSDF